jgi:hypothetical protein
MNFTGSTYGAVQGSCKHGTESWATINMGNTNKTTESWATINMGNTNKTNSVTLVHERITHRRLSAKLVPIFADRVCCVVSTTDPYDRILGFLIRSSYYFFQAAIQMHSRGWADPVPDPLLLRKSGSARYRTLDLWICSQELWPLDHRGVLRYGEFLD